MENHDTDPSPFEQDAANLVFQLVSSRYEHASLILMSNLPFSVSWGGVFGDQAVAVAMIDRIVHHADVLILKGASYRDSATAASTPSPASELTPTTTTTNLAHQQSTAHFSPGTTAQIPSVTDRCLVETDRSLVEMVMGDKLTADLD